MTSESQAHYRTALGRFSTGVCIITCLDAQARPLGLTCNSFTSLSLKPRLVSWALQADSASRAAFERAARFVVNVLAADQAELAMRFAKRSSHKFDGLDYIVCACGPVIAGALAHFECKTESTVLAGDHVLYIGHVEHFAQRQAEPLLFQNGKLGA